MLDMIAVTGPTWSAGAWTSSTKSHRGEAHLQQDRHARGLRALLWRQRGQDRGAGGQGASRAEDLPQGLQKAAAHHCLALPVHPRSLSRPLGFQLPVLSWTEVTSRVAATRADPACPRAPALPGVHPTSSHSGLKVAGAAGKVTALTQNCYFFLDFTTPLTALPFEDLHSYKIVRTATEPLKPWYLVPTVTLRLGWMVHCLAFGSSLHSLDCK
jgi:hypothetical protein